MSAGGKYTNKIYQAVSPIHQLLLAVPGYESKRIRVVYLSIIVFVVLDHILSRIHQWLLAVPGYKSEREYGLLAVPGYKSERIREV